MAGGVGQMGGLTNPGPGAEDSEPVILVPVGLPCLKKGRLVKKRLPSSGGQRRVEQFGKFTAVALVFKNK